MAVPSPRRPRIRRRWPSAAFVLAAVASVMIAWRVANTRSIGMLPVAGKPVAVARVVDGDTLLLKDGHRIRLLGVNTPETRHPDREAEPLGPEASAFTESLIEGGSVILEYDRERLDNYRRVLAYVYLPDGRMLNRELIQHGMSPAIVTFPIRSDRRRVFLEAEREAQRNAVGIWSLPEWKARQDANPSLKGP